MASDYPYLEKLLKEVPEFTQRYNEVIEDNNGEILPYVIFGELAGFFIEKFKNKDIVADRIQEYLESLLKQNSKEINEIVSFGFLENLAMIMLLALSKLR